MSDHASTRSARLLASAASDNAAIAVNGFIILNEIIGYNARAGTVFLKLYQLSPAQIAANTPPSAADTPFMTLALPASAAFAFDLAKGLRFGFGVGFRLTTGVADNDATAVAANDILGLNFLGR